MTNTLESEILTRVGPGTMMGGLMRQYWIPAAKSSEIVQGGPPIRLMLLGEKLIAFRDRSGWVGIMDHRCPHRCASLFFGRNEQDGLRCIYHGWKFDAAGNCLEMPNVPADQDFRHKVKAHAYRTEERNGLVWVFMGDQDAVPALPDLEPMLLSEDQLRVLFVQRECNWLQALEGDIDTSHFGFLHAGSVAVADVEPDEIARYNITHKSPMYEVSETEWGTMYGAYREVGGDQRYWRFAHFLFPFWTIPPDGAFRSHVIVRAWVPMDDTHTMFVHLSWTRNEQGLRNDRNGVPLPGMTMNMEFLPNSSDWLGRWRLAANAGNDYRIDREAQATNNFSGIVGIHLQDQAITESMGAIVDHSLEHLAPSDHMITQTRRTLIKAAKTFATTGTPPPGVADPEIFLGARGGDFMAPGARSWREAYGDQMKSSLNPTGRLRIAD